MFLNLYWLFLNTNTPIMKNHSKNFAPSFFNSEKKRLNRAELRSIMGGYGGQYYCRAECPGSTPNYVECTGTTSCYANDFYGVICATPIVEIRCPSQ